MKVHALIALSFVMQFTYILEWSSAFAGDLTSVIDANDVEHIGEFGREESDQIIIYRIPDGEQLAFKKNDVKKVLKGISEDYVQKKVGTINIIPWKIQSKLGDPQELRILVAPIETKANERTSDQEDLTDQIISLLRKNGSKVVSKEAINKGLLEISPKSERSFDLKVFQQLAKKFGCTHLLSGGVIIKNEKPRLTVILRKTGSDSSVLSISGEVFLPNSPRSFSSNSNVKKNDGFSKRVEAEGIGETKQDAQKDALQNAVRIAIGTHLSSETMVQNDALIKENILVMSDGFVETFSVIPNSETFKDGLWRVRIIAKVKNSALYKILTDNHLPVLKIDGGSLVARAITQANSDQEYDAYLRKQIKRFNTEAVKATVANYEIQKQTATDDRMQVELLIKLQTDVHTYLEIVKSITNTGRIIKKGVIQTTQQVDFNTNSMASRLQVSRYFPVYPNSPISYNTSQGEFAICTACNTNHSSLQVTYFQADPIFIQAFEDSRVEPFYYLLEVIQKDGGVDTFVEKLDLKPCINQRLLFPCYEIDMNFNAPGAVFSKQLSFNASKAAGIEEIRCRVIDKEEYDGIRKSK
jgi:hypothetical protein